ncbi:DUF805 domain-containing protein [Deinococcus metallilatus]|uniref:DUF805 domain-containing protein n=1 Tax=Deinococcus metallilatus TaxID=1211322 RepID=A0AAJ5F2Z7_9DEIO|nr:DUF805 domain-containing protein [Deinococcus metallilatus]MBB5296662.1 uncharacterized membrane protein YhaH (DUF805 family) [Deinococcus metallilatus]QBY09252.1 DUF805 domain-containing protein [Deinococcus metallilatus]RXJ09773.1 DUF805 domain-containing protein [Deinococcus metallilatus]TLK24238.1 DUF805 domain-containing protein [Deinococcus metallilatus]GMA13692.1 DUF805 domain-containing protein [Deinococcus metallilatus]
MNEYLNVIRNHYADFRGRARRREYWMFYLINTIISLILYLPFIVQTVGAPDPESVMPSGLALVSSLLFLLYSLAVFLPALAVSVRRLHDTGRSGWWFLINFVPLVGGLVFFIFTVLDSQPGPNKWGPNPKGMQSSGAAAW